jgi:hypothetical protein
MEMEDVKSLDIWGVVEVMGHKKFAGRVTEQAIGSASLVRIDVPALCVAGKNGPVQLSAFTKLFGVGSIYCITPCTEETARCFAAQMRSEAFSQYEAPRLAALPELATCHAASAVVDDDYDEDDLDDDDWNQDDDED